MMNSFDNSFGQPPGGSSGGGSRTGGIDRRMAVRRPLRANAMVLLPGQPGRPCRTIDVSETGICVALADALPPSTQCLVAFELPDRNGERKRYQCKASVAMSVLSSQDNGFRVGMQFIAPPDDVVGALQVYIRE